MCNTVLLGQNGYSERKDKVCLIMEKLLLHSIQEAFIKSHLKS